MTETQEVQEEMTVEAIVDAAVRQALDNYGMNDIVKRFTPGHDEGEEPKGDEQFKSFGEQMQAVYMAATPGQGVDPRLKAATGLSEGVPSDGGFLVQQDFSNELLQNVHDTGILYPKCRRLPISANSTGIKINAVDETSRVAGSRWGGIRGYWAAEAAEKTKSKPKFKQLELSLQKLVGLCYATDELLQDTAALGTVLMQGFSEEFNFLVDDAIVRGTGAGQPLGLLNANCLISVGAETGQAATTIVAENIQKMWARLYNRSRRNAYWYINQDCLPQLHSMSLAVGTGGVPVYMPAGGLSGQPYGTLYGRPVIEIEHCATLGAQGDIILADLSQYLVIEKGGIQSASSIHVRFIYDETAFRFVWRVDGQPAWTAALTPFQGSNDVSPFIVLDART